MDHVSGLALRIGGHDMVLDRMQPGQVSAAYQLVLSEAELGEDRGVDEFPTQEHLRMHLTHTDSFSLVHAHTGALAAFISIAHTAFSRQMNPTTADAIIVCALDVKASIIEPLIWVTLDLTTHLKYESILMTAFMTSGLTGQLRTEGFMVVGCIPNSGLLKRNGWTANFILHKHLHSATFKILQDVPPCISQAHPNKDTAEEEEALSPLVNMIKKPRLQYLPCRYTLQSGDEVIIRYIAEEDISVLYEMYKQASNQANGYSVDEFETLAVFRFFVVDYAHAFIIESVKTAEILASISIVPSTVCQTVNPQSCDVFMIVNPKVRDKGVGSDVSRIITRFAIDLGYTSGGGDCLVNNYAMLRVIRNQGFFIVGYIPNASKGKDGKMEDTVLFHRDFTDRSATIAKL